MKSIFIFYLTLLLILWRSASLGAFRTTPPPKKTPEFLKEYQRFVKNHFERPETANVLFSMITGNKNGISPYTKKAFQKTNLSHLLSPSGIHYGSFLFLLFYWLKKIKNKKATRFLKLLIYGGTLFVPGLYSIWRLALLRLLLQLKFIFKKNIPLEVIFYLTFFISWIFGHYEISPLGYVMSYAFLGTFFSWRDYSKGVLVLALFSTQLMIALFLGNHVSLFSIAAGLLGSALFAFIFPLLLLFLATFWIVPLNWGEPLLRAFILSIQSTAKILQGSFTSSSVFLVLALWVLLFLPSSRIKFILFIIFFFLHSNTAFSPSIFHNHS